VDVKVCFGGPVLVAGFSYDVEHEDVDRLEITIDDAKYYVEVHRTGVLLEANQTTPVGTAMCVYPQAENVVFIGPRS
jgi:hypothetical protein